MYALLFWMLLDPVLSEASAAPVMNWKGRAL